MNGLLAIVTRAIVVAADPTPSPVPEFTGDPNLVSPGIAGFIVTALIALATVGLIIDMTRRIRRVRYRAEVRERLETEKLDDELRAIADGESPTGPDKPGPLA